MTVKKSLWFLFPGIMIGLGFVFTLIFWEISGESDPQNAIIEAGNALLLLGKFVIPLIFIFASYFTTRFAIKKFKETK